MYYMPNSMSLLFEFRKKTIQFCVLGDFLYTLLFFICLLQINICQNDQEQRIRELEKRVQDLEVLYVNAKRFEFNFRFVLKDKQFIPK